MPTFLVTAITGEGRSVSQTVTGANEADVRAQMRAKGLFPTKIKEPLASRFSRGSLKASNQEVCHLFEQLELQLAEGVLPEQAIAALKDEFPSTRIRTILREVHAALASSKSNLPQAFALFPRTFPPDVITIIEAGQSAGSAALAVRFGDLRDRLQFNQEVRRTIMGAVAYPAFVFFLASLLIVFLLGNVFPKMIDLLFSLGTTLPPLTLAVMGVSRFFQHHFWLILLTVACAPFVIIALRRIPKVAYAMDRWMLRAPLLGDIYRSLVTALVAKNYRSLYVVGMPSPEALDLCTRMVGNRAVQENVRHVKREVLAGKSLGVAFRKSGYFPSMACMTIATGETAGRLEVALNRVASFYEKDAKRKIEMSVGVLKPMVVIGAVAIVGVVLLSFFLPLISILQNIH